jgi:sn-glycerol 3-phosphate transport system ATP-binding protein
MTLGQRIVVMNAGRIEQVGPPDTVYREPATTFVAGFIGAPPMNLLTGRIADDGRDFIGDDMVLPLPDGPRPASGRPVVLGIRPEHLHVRSEGIVAQVEMVESLGAEQLVHLRIGRHALVMRHDTDTMPAGTSETRLAFTAADLRWFDPQTGQRVAV